MTQINIGTLREFEKQAEKFHHILFDALSLNFSGKELDYELIKLTGLTATPHKLVTVDSIDKAPSNSAEVGELYRSPEQNFDVLYYPIVSGHNEHIKIEKVFREHFTRQLESQRIILHKPIDDYAAHLAYKVILGDDRSIRNVFDLCFDSEEKFKEVVRVLHDSLDIPMYVICNHITWLYPKQVTLVKNWSLVCHENDGNTIGTQAIYDVPRVTGKKTINKQYVEELVNNITTSPDFRDDTVAHTYTGNDAFVSRQVARYINPDSINIEGCSIYLVKNTSMHIKR